MQRSYHCLNPIVIACAYGFQRIGCRDDAFSQLQWCCHTTTAHEIFVRLTWHLRKIYPAGILQRLIAAGMCLYADRIVTSIEFYRKLRRGFTRKKIEVIPVAPNFDGCITAEQVSKSKDAYTKRQEDQPTV